MTALNSLIPLGSLFSLGFSTVGKGIWAIAYGCVVILTAAALLVAYPFALLICRVSIAARDRKSDTEEVQHGA